MSRVVPELSPQVPVPKSTADSSEARRHSVVTVGFRTPRVADRDHVWASWPRAEALYDSAPCQLAIYLALFLALFGMDVYDLASVGDEHLCGLWIALIAVLVLFCLELVLCTRVKPHYFLSFFFWTDLVGALSLCFDIPWLNPLATGNADEATVLRSSSGDRAGYTQHVARLMRLLRVVRAIKLVKGAKAARWLLCGGREAAERAAQKAAAQGEAAKQSQESATLVSDHLSDVLSKRATLLVMLMVVTLPFLLQPPEDSHGTRAYALQAVATLREHGNSSSNSVGGGNQRAIDQVFSAFASSTEVPVRLELASVRGGAMRVYQPLVLPVAVVARCCTGCTSSDLNGSTAPGGICFVRARTTRARHNITYVYQHADGAESRLECDQRRAVVHRATFGTLFVFYVVLLLVCSSTVLASTTHTMLAAPLAGIFAVATQALEGVMGAIDGLSRIKQFAECGDQIESLQDTVRRLGRIVAVGKQSRARGSTGGEAGEGALASSAEADAETREWLQEECTRPDRSITTAAGAMRLSMKRIKRQAFTRGKLKAFASFTSKGVDGHGTAGRPADSNGDGVIDKMVDTLDTQGDCCANVAVGPSATTARSAPKGLGSDNGDDGGDSGNGDGGMIGGGSDDHRNGLTVPDLLPKMEVLARLGGWEYCSLDYCTAERAARASIADSIAAADVLGAHVFALFERLGTWTHFHVAPTAARSFARAALRGYSDSNPYHNCFHAVDTLYYFVALLERIKGDQLLSRLDIFAGLVAALGHDLGHPGVTNAYLIATRDELALTYNDTSVLENMHCASLYKLLAEEEGRGGIGDGGGGHGGILAALSGQQWADMRRTIVRCILATDMAGHFKMVAELETFYEANAVDLAPAVLYTAEDNAFQTETRGRFLVEVLLHCADVSNVAKPLRTCELWTPRVMDEFFMQGDREKAMGIVPIAMHDRERATAAQSQVGFIEFVVGPLYASVIKIFPRLADPVAGFLIGNRAHYAAQHLLELPDETREEEATKDLERQAKFAARFPATAIQSPSVL